MEDLAVIGAWESLATRLGILWRTPKQAVVAIPKLIEGRPARFVRLVGEGPTPRDAVINLMSQL